MKNSAKTVFLWISVLMVLYACAGSKGPPDPAEIQEARAATLEDEREMIRSTVTSAERADNLIALLGDRDRLVFQYGETVKAYRKQITDMMADYGADRASFDQAIAMFNRDRARTQRQIAELVDAMKKETSTEEWKAIAKYQTKKLGARDFAYDDAAGGS